MRIEYSLRVEDELIGIFNFGVKNFGRQVAEATLRRLHHVLEVSLVSAPYIGRYLPDHKIYRLVIPRTPFVAYYRVKAQAGIIEVVAIFRAGQNRAEFDDN